MRNKNGNDTDGDKIAARLRGCREEELVEATKVAREFGRVWAANDASYVELRQIVALEQSESAANGDTCWSLLCRVIPGLGDLNDALVDEEEPTRELIRHFDIEFATAFVCGAKDVWEEVAGKL